MKGKAQQQPRVEGANMYLKNYVELRQIGKSQQGDIVLVRHKKDNRQYISKKVKFSKEDQGPKSAAMNEVDIPAYYSVLPKESCH